MANSYDFQLSVNSDMSSPSVDLTAGTALSVSHYLTSGLSLNTTYYYRVKKHTPSGISPWTPTRSFVYADPIDTRLKGLGSLAAYYRGADAAGPGIAAYHGAAASGRNLVINQIPSSATTWTLNANWAYASNLFTHTPGSVATILQALVSTAAPVGRIYEVIFTISGSTTGSVTSSLGTSGPTHTGNATYTDLLISTSGNLVFTPSSTFDGSISGFSVKLMNIKASSFYPTLEQIKDTDFDCLNAAWATATNWAIASSKATHTSGNTTALVQTLSIQIGRTYDCIVVVSGRTAGGVTPRAGSSGTGGTSITANGTAATQTLTCGGSAVFALVPDSAFDGAIESVSLVPNDGLLVWDGAFEVWTSPTVPTNWTVVLLGTSTVNKETSVTHGGSFAFRMDIDASNSGVNISQLICKTGHTYLAEAWMKASSAGVTARFSNTASTAILDVTLTTSYVKYSTIFNATDTGFFLRRLVATSASIYIDDVTLTEIDPATGVANGLTFNQSTSNPLADNVLLFNGTTDYMIVANPYLNSLWTPLTNTYEFYVQWVANAGGIFLKLGNNSTSYIQIRTTSNIITVNYKANSVATDISSGVTLDNGNHLITVTVDVPGDALILYLDGVQIGIAHSLGTEFFSNLILANSIWGAGQSSLISPANAYMGYLVITNAVQTAAETLAQAQLLGVAS